MEESLSDLSGVEPADEPAEVRMYFIYSISGFGKQYIGSTCDYNRRMREHKSRVATRPQLLYQFIRENGGWDLFQNQVIESRNMTLAEALMVERVYTKQFNAELNGKNADLDVNGIDLDEYFKAIKGKTGKEREAIYKRMHFEANRERTREKRREHCRVYRERNREKERARHIEYRQRIKEQKQTTDPSKGPVT